jgi:hypothetical protein
MDPKKPEAVPNIFAARSLRAVPGVKKAAPLTDAEIVKLRQLLVDFDTLATGCPLARRELSKR